MRAWRGRQGPRYLPALGVRPNCGTWGLVPARRGGPDVLGAAVAVRGGGGPTCTAVVRPWWWGEGRWQAARMVIGRVQVGWWTHAVFLAVLSFPLRLHTAQNIPCSVNCTHSGTPAAARPFCSAWCIRSPWAAILHLLHSAGSSSTGLPLRSGHSSAAVSSCAYGSNEPFPNLGRLEVAPGVRTLSASQAGPVARHFLIGRVVHQACAGRGRAG